MSVKFNNLTPQQEEQLACLAEEAAEVVQCVTKILRHGYQSTDPTNPQSLTNRADLEKELGNLMAVVWVLNQNNELNISRISNWRIDKLQTLGMYTHYPLLNKEPYDNEYEIHFNSVEVPEISNA